MHLAKRKRVTARKASSELNGKKRSLRELKAFGLWAGRADTKDPVQFTTALRRRMEHGNDAR